MPRPRTSTRDQMLEYFDACPLDVQASLIEQFQLIHRLSKKRAGKPKPVAPEQESLSGFPDEDQHR